MCGDCRSAIIKGNSGDPENENRLPGARARIPAKSNFRNGVRTMEEKQQNYTQQGFEALKNRLEALKVRREENKKDISTARSFGDLSENSEYDEAKTEQAKIAQEILEVEELIKNAHVIDESEIDHTVVNIGSTVTVLNRERGREVTYHIVGSFETDPFAGKISDVSPIGRALLGARVGAVVEAETPAGLVHLQIMQVSRT